MDKSTSGKALKNEGWHVGTHEGRRTAQGTLLPKTSLVTAHTYLSWKRKRRRSFKQSTDLLLNSRQYPTILLTTSTILSLFSSPLPTPKIPALRVQHSQLFVKKINHFRVSSIPFTYWKMRWEMMGRGGRGEAWTIPCGGMSQLCGWLQPQHNSMYAIHLSTFYHKLSRTQCCGDAAAKSLDCGRNPEYAERTHAGTGFSVASKWIKQ